MLPAALLLLLLSAPRDVFYSAGQNTLDHQTSTDGGLQMTLSGGVATFSEAQTAPNLGVGDAVDYATSSTPVFLAAKVDTSTWKVTTALGTAPPDSAPALVNAIHHAFGSLDEALGDFNGNEAGDGHHLNTTDLVAAAVALHIACYCDTGPEVLDAHRIELGGWTTSGANRIHIFAPRDVATECNQSQRHAGVWDPTKFAIQNNTGDNLLDLFVLDVHLEGLQLLMTVPDGSTFADAVDLRMAGHFDVNDNLIAAVVGGSSNIIRAIEVEGGGYGPDYGDAGVTRIWNNIIYGFINPGFGTHGIEHQFYAPDVLLVFNNTFVHNDAAFIGSTVGISVLKNNLFYDNASFSSSGFTSGCNNLFGPVSEPSAPPCGLNDAVTVTFRDAGAFDFHLATRLDGGLNLSTDPDLSFADDVDGDPRPLAAAWDLGADQLAEPVRDAGPVDAGAADAGARDAGVADGGDGASTDAGSAPRTLGAGCGCGSAPSVVFLTGALGLLCVVRRRRAS